MTAKITDGKIVAFHYTLTDDDGDVLDSSEGEEPLAYLQGSGSIVPGLEAQMAGHVAGDEFTADVAAADAYGERDEEAEQVSAPLSAFPEDAELMTGMPLVLEDEEGDEHSLWVTEITDTDVILDPNHPLAGFNLHFAVEVVEIRDATDIEKEHGHPHGPDHAHH